MVSLDDRLPVEWRVDRVSAHCAEPLDDVRQAAEAALARPLSSLPLSMLCGEGSRVTLVCDDPATDTDCPDRILVPAVLRELRTAGVNDEDIIILAASGGHRRSMDAEKRRKLGDEVVDRYGVADHNADDMTEMDDLGTFDGVPVLVNYRAVEADLLVSTGVVRPHPRAGYTGGSMTVAVGCAGAPTLHELNAPPILDDPSVRAGGVRDNLFQRVVREIGHRAGLRFVLDVVVNPDGAVVAVAAGAPNAVHDRLVEFARDIYEVAVPRESYHVVVAGLSSRPTRDLYRASCDAAFVTRARDPILARGGVVVLPIGYDGLHSKQADRQRFYDALLGAPDMQAVAQQLRRDGIQAGQQCAYVLAQGVAQRDYHVVVVGPSSAQLPAGSGLIAARDLAEAADLAEAFVGRRPYALVLPTTRWLVPAYRGVNWLGEVEREAPGDEPAIVWLEETRIESRVPERESYSDN